MIKGTAFYIIGWLITIFLSVLGSWSAMDKRVYEVEARIRLIEARSDTNDKIISRHLEEAAFIKESLIRIEGKLDLKQDRFK